MKREIKFRVWDRELNKMRPVKFWELARDGQMVVKVGEPNQVGVMLYPNEFEIMQFTGLKDGRGKEIYEGDVISRGRYSSNKVVRFEEKRGGWEISNKSPERHLYLGLTKRLAETSEVIGNVYENPSLISNEGERK